MKIFSCQITIAALLVFISAGALRSEELTVTSPGGDLSMKVNLSDSITYSVWHKGTQLIAPSRISITLVDGRVIGMNATKKQTATGAVSEDIPILYGKNATLHEEYNELSIEFNENFTLVTRAYDEGVAYRFVTDLGDSEIRIASEQANFNFTGTPIAWLPVGDAAMRSHERIYTKYNSIQEFSSTAYSITPAMFGFTNGVKVVIAESDLYSYPSLNLMRSGDNGMRGMWANYPKTVEKPDDPYSDHKVLSRENYIAKSGGTRAFPWRVVIVSAQDKYLLNNQLVFKLARPQAITKTDYIQPGRSVWEWWHDALLEDPNIPSGDANLSLKLYRVYIDFAAANGFEYVTLDARWGWKFGIQELGILVDYATPRGVKIIAWDFFNMTLKNPARFTQFKNAGVAGLKLDLINRYDQEAVDWVETLAKGCADNDLLLVMHGCPMPAGLHRMYPNLINIEALRGAECYKWDKNSNTSYHTQLPFIRMLAGPMDFTPGSMRNVRIADFRPIDPGIPMSIGTRSHELALSVIFDQYLAYLCDSPTEYNKYPDVLSFYSKLPATFDKTVPLAGAVGEYVLMAKQKGNDWFVGGITNTRARDMEVDFSFLPAGKQFKALVFRDVPGGEAKEYICEEVNVDSQSKLTVKATAEGGFAMYIAEGTSEPTGAAQEEFSANALQLYVDFDLADLRVQSMKGNIRQLRIVNMQGIVVLQRKYAGDSSECHLNIARLNPGMYIVSAEVEQGAFASKLLY
jgi:alpha-glucosidase